MLKKYFFLFLLLTSCATEKKIIVINNDNNYKSNSEHVTNLVGQVFNHYQKPSNSNICIPRANYELDSQIENDFRKATKIRISEVLQYNQYYIDTAFFIPSRKDPLFVRIVLKGDVCDSFILEDFKLYDKQ